jgi:hypothetical protein
MRSTNILAAITMLTISFSVFGQEQTKTIKKISIHDVYIQTGLSSEQLNSGTISDFKILAPQSILLNNDMTNFKQSNGFGLMSNSMFSVLVGLQFSNKEKTMYKPNPLLRLGFTYSSGTNLMSGSFKEDRIPFDTLTSSQTGQTAFIDSINTERYNMNYTSEQLRFDGSVIFRTNPEARWSLFTGIGITAGISINARTDIYYSNYGTAETTYADGTSSSSPSYGYSYSNIGTTETFRNKRNFGLSTYIPMGIDFRIGKKREFWQRTHLFYELRPSINMTSIPGLQTFTNATIQQGIGVKVSWN